MSARGGHGHGHGHPHEHGHGHPHEHGHGHGAAGALAGSRAEWRTPRLSAGAGEGKLLFLDAQSGIAGDMTIAALVDLGVPAEVVEEAVTALGLPGVELRFVAAAAGAIAATRFDVVVERSQPERTWRSIDELLVGAPLAREVRALARRIFRRLGDAEAEVHGIPIERVQFHEVGAVDAMVDVVGAAACFAHLRGEVVASPLPLGRGRTDSRHGPLPLPAPATLLCLRGAPTVDAGIEGELVTPTGAAIVSVVAERYASWPSLVPSAVGWGAGVRALPDRPNALRAVLGAPLRDTSAPCARVALLEANVDDLTGEQAAHALEALLEAGALDAWAAPVTMKKGRPGLVLAALAAPGTEDLLAGVLLRETTTIGVRRSSVERTERPRRVESVETRWGAVPVKISEGPWGPPQVKPEHDACAAIARAHGVPLRQVAAEALAAALARLRER